MTRVAPFSKDFGLASQIQRASVSIPSNVAEEFERNNPAEFHQALSVAKGSCAEVRTQLVIARDVGYLSESQLTVAMERAEHVAERRCTDR